MLAHVAVTGASGFLGRHLVARLLARGDRVVGIDRRPAAAPPAGQGRHVHLVAELTDPDALVLAALREARAVVHLAGCPGVRDRAADVEARRQRDNVLATSVVTRVVEPGTPLVVTSSSSVYGGTQGGRACRESDRLAPRGGYARSKVVVERLCRQRAARGGRVLVARPFTVAGEGQRPDMALATWIRAAAAGRPLQLLGAPGRTRDVTDVRDVAEVLARLADLGETGTVNVGTGHGHRLEDLADAVCAAVGRDVPRVVVPAHGDEVPDTLADTSRLQDLVGFVPRTDLAALVQRQARAAGATGAVAALVPAASA